jgi:diadenosine tetraphosphatase ApaH/serine/threonine PP2A family protein phosphatase
MRYLVLTDIHANLEALQTCLADAVARGYDNTLVLGDIVGYGADPNAVIERVRGLAPTAIIRGNHDKVALGIEQAECFNAVARNAAEWMLEALTPDNRQWLVDLVKGPREVDDLVQICHGSPTDEDEYLFDQFAAAQALQATARPLCLFGHTHCAITYRMRNGACDTIPGSANTEAVLTLQPNVKYLVNPGSVGQPRDGDPRAGYGIVDTEARRVWLFRLEYDIEGAQRKILAAGLPEALARRLAAGR